MRIYFDYSDAELLTEEEARERAVDRVDLDDVYIDVLKTMDLYTLWNMLDEQQQFKIIEQAIDMVLEEEFICREF